LSRLGYSVADTRDMLSYAASHIPDSYALSLMGNLSTFAAWVLPPDKPVLLVLPAEKDLDNVLKAFYRVGLDNVVGFLKGGMEEYMQSGLFTARFESISAYELKEKLDKDEVLLIDTRLKNEWDEFHIQNSVHIPAPDIRSRYKEINNNKPAAFLCSSGVRSVLAASIFQNRTKRNDIYNVTGGIGAFINAGFKVI